MNERAHARLMMEENLRSATERNDFELLFQPQVMLASGKLRASKGCCAGRRAMPARTSRAISFRCWRKPD